MKHLDDIRDNLGYYYVNEKFNVNDFVLFIAFLLFSFALIIVELFYPFKDTTPEFSIIFLLTCIAFLSPFAIHFISKFITMFIFKLQKNTILKKGQSYRAEIIDSQKGRVLFYDKTNDIKKYSYYPIIKIYKNEEFHTYTSKFDVSNSENNALTSKMITVYLYKNKFIITDYYEAFEKDLSYSYLKTNSKRFSKSIDKLNRIVMICGFISILIVNLFRLAVKFLKYFYLY